VLIDGGIFVRGWAGVLRTLTPHPCQRYYVALSEHKPKKKMGTVKGDMTRSRRASWMLQVREILPPPVLIPKQLGLGFNKTG
jgi:hypothetical protein